MSDLPATVRKSFLCARRTLVGGGPLFVFARRLLSAIRSVKRNERPSNDRRQSAAKVVD